MDLTWIHHHALLVSNYPRLAIHKFHDCDIKFVHIFNTFPEPGDCPDILSRFLTANLLEELPYVEGYCGEFLEGIMQQAGPHWITSLFIFFLFKFLLFLIIYISHFLRQQ